jgi:Uma2 family endonuclease
MRADVTRKLFTVDDYYRMAEAGIIKPEDRVELIEGEIVEMRPIGIRHAGCVNRVTDLLTHLFRGKATVTVQNPARLNQYNEPQPDLILAKPRADYYSSQYPTGEDIFLMIEIADTTLRKDRNVKVPIYARLGVPEVWIGDLQHDRILVFRDPAGSSYQTSLTLQRGDSLSVAAFPEITFKVEDLLG